MEESDHLPEHSDRRVSPAGLCSARDGGHSVCVCVSVRVLCMSLLQEDDL